MTEYAYNWIIAILPGLIYPILSFAYFLQHRGRKAQMEQLLAVSDVKQAYLRAFGEVQRAGKAERDAVKDGQTKTEPRNSQPETELAKNDSAKDVLDNPLDLDRKSWFVPITISVLSAVGGTVVCMIFSGRQFGFPAGVEMWIRANVTPFAIAGFAGGYLWGLYDILERFAILNWTPESIHWLYFRLLLGPTLGAYIASMAHPQIGRFVAFAVAAFPAGAIRDWMMALARSKLHLPDSTESNVKPEWELVQGLTPDIVDRLKRAGVSSTAHLANEDPLRLLRVTNIAWRNILDMLDQACLAIYVGDKIARLRPMGIRGSVEMAALYNRWRNPKDTGMRERAEATLNRVDSILGREEALNVGRNLAHDPVIALLDNLWFGDTLSDSTSGKEEEAARAAPSKA
jgi:hypothetical protein